MSAALELAIGDTSLDVVVKDRDELHQDGISAPVRELRVGFDAAAATQPQIDALTRVARRIGVVTTGTDGSRLHWRLGMTSHTQHQSTIAYSWQLQEVVAPHALRVDDIELHPYRYEEHVASRRLEIQARVLVPAAVHEQLVAMIVEEKPVRVQRDGLSADTREMRMSLDLWSEHDDGVRLALHLGDLVGEESPTSLGAHWAAQRLAIAAALERSDRLMDLLCERGVITASDRDAIMQAAHKAAPRRSLRQFRVANVDDVPFEY
jgi:hypothetical protein